MLKSIPFAGGVGHFYGIFQVEGTKHSEYFLFIWELNDCFTTLPLKLLTQWNVVAYLFPHNSGICWNRRVSHGGWVTFGEYFGWLRDNLQQQPLEWKDWRCLSFLRCWTIDRRLLAPWPRDQGLCPWTLPQTTFRLALPRWLYWALSGPSAKVEGIFRVVENFGPDLPGFIKLKCTKFGQLILKKISKILITRCQILRLKCTKFDFGWGSPDPAGGAGCLRPRRIFALKYGTYYLLKWLLNNNSIMPIMPLRRYLRRTSEAERQFWLIVPSCKI